MPAYLLYSTVNHLDNSTGRNACIAIGANEAAARAAAIAAAPGGETRVPAAWTALLLATTEHADLTAVGPVLWFQRPAEPLRASRGS